MTKTKQRNIIIICLLAVVLLMGIGYAAFSSKLNVTGTSNISSNFLVRITNVETKDTIGDASNASEPTFTDTSATFAANFKSPGDSISYDITVSNLGETI